MRQRRLVLLKQAVFVEQVEWVGGQGKVARGGSSSQSVGVVE